MSFFEEFTFIGVNRPDGENVDIGITAPVYAI